MDSNQPPPKKRTLLFWGLSGLSLAALIALSIPVGYFVLDPSASPVGDPRPAAEILPGTVGVYIINLDRSKERYASIKGPAEALGFPVTRLSATDGKTLEPQEIKTAVDFESYTTFMGHGPELGTIGCSFSHIRSWRAFLNSPYEFALVLEDDVSFDPQTLRNALENIVKYPSLWDIVNFENHHRGMPLPLHRFPNQQTLVVYLTEQTHTGAYLVNRNAAKRLLAQALPIKMPIDHYFTRTWEMGLTFTGLENPRLVHQTFGDSTIAQSQRLPGKTLSFQRALQRSLYKLQSYVIRFFYNLKIYGQHWSNEWLTYSKKLLS